MWALKEAISPSVDLPKTEQELLEALGNAEEDVRYGRTAPLSDTFDKLRGILEARS